MTAEEILTLPAGSELDALVDDALGIDRTASTPKRILLSILDASPVGVPWPGDDYHSLIDVDGVRHKIIRDEGSSPYPMTWVWEQRHGKPWQAALEKHVSAWRAPPSRQWSTDPSAMLELLEKMRGIDVPCEHFRDVKGPPMLTMGCGFDTAWWACWELTIGVQPERTVEYLHMAGADTLPLAVCRAFLKEKASRA